MMVLEVLDRWVLVVLDAEAPTDGEWADYLVEWLWHPARRAGHLIFTAGGLPTARQCYHLLELASEVGVPVAVVSRAVEIRGVVHVLSWLNHKTRAFRPEDLGDAIAHLGVPASRAKLLEREVTRMRRSLGLLVEGGAA